VLLVNSNPGLVPGDQDESTLDVEWAGATAPGAAIKFVVASSTATTDGIALAAQYIVNHATAPIVSTSYGSCETNMGAAQVSFYNSLWQQAAAEGISSFVSSGDSGAAGCDGGSSRSGSQLGVNGLCSSPYATCVGGTQFKEGNGVYWSPANGTGNASALGYIPEGVWNESASNGGSGLWSSGGGASRYFKQPAWQAGLNGIGPANGMRAVPDVSLTAALHDGYIVMENGSPWVVAGTSAASPAFAGIMALVVQREGGQGLGNANPGLYNALAANKNPFHATPSGSNAVPGVSGFIAAGAPYNLATGLGSVDAAELVTAWRASNTVQQAIDFNLLPSATSGLVAAGKSTTFTLAVSESTGRQNPVSFTASAPSGISGNITPGSILPGQNATVTVAASAATTPGAKTIAITASDSTGTRAASYTLTVSPAPTLALSASPASLVIAQGASGSVSLRALTGGSFTGNITYSLSGLPAGVTAKWSANPQTPAGSVSTNTETLTLSAQTTAVAGKMSTVVLTATGSGLTASTNLAIQIQPRTANAHH
jgi:pseudomonalisin